MEKSILETLGAIAGIGGVSLGVLLLLFRGLLEKLIVPGLTRKQWYRVVLVFLLLVWSIAIIGIGAWVYTTVVLSDNQRHVNEIGQELNEFAVVKPVSIDKIRDVPFLSDPIYEDKFEFISDERVVDLGGWKPVHPSHDHKRYSPTNWYRKIKLRKLSDTSSIRIQYGTRSRVGIDLECKSHAIYRIEKTERAGYKEDEIVNIYQIVVDVSNEKIGSDFYLEINATIWNGFQKDKEKATFSVKVPVPLVSLLVQFPEEKPYLTYRTGIYSFDEKEEKEWEGKGILLAGMKNHRLLWKIENPLVKHGYRLWWTW